MRREQRGIVRDRYNVRQRLSYVRQLDVPQLILCGIVQHLSLWREAEVHLTQLSAEVGSLIARDRTTAYSQGPQESDRHPRQDPTLTISTV